MSAPRWAGGLGRALRPTAPGITPKGGCDPAPFARARPPGTAGADIPARAAVGQWRPRRPYGRCVDEARRDLERDEHSPIAYEAAQADALEEAA